MTARILPALLPGILAHGLALGLALGLATPAPAQQAGAPPTLADAVEDPATLIRLAESALAARRLREAQDLLERAESRLLTRSELATEADRPAVGGAIGDLAAARDALARRDQAGASGLMATALRRLDRGEPPAILALPSAPRAAPVPGAASSGFGAAPPPAFGGGAPPTGWAPPPAAGFQGLPGIAPQNMPVGGTASPPVPIGPDTEPPAKSAQPPGYIPPASSKPPPLQ